MRDDIKKRRVKYENVVTPAMKFFHDKDMIVERKSGMNFVHYTYMRALQTRALRLMFKGRPANERISAAMRPQQMSKHMMLQLAKHRGLLQEIQQTEKPVLATNWITKLFNFIRRIFALNYGATNTRTAVSAF
jgi:hypothetical protein